MWGLFHLYRICVQLFVERKSKMYDPHIKAQVFNELPEGYRLGVNENDEEIVNVEAIVKQGEITYIITSTPRL